MGDPAGRAGRSEKHLFGAGHLGERKEKRLGNYPAPGFTGRTQSAPFQPAVQQEKAIPEQMMGFLGSLMGEE